MENFEQHYESEATEDYVQVWSVSRCLLLGERKNPPNSIRLLSVFVFPTVNVFLEDDRAGSWWKPFIFLDEAGQEMEECLRAQRLRGTQNDVLWGPPTECDFLGAPKQNQCNGPTIPSDSTEMNHGFRPIHSLSPFIYPSILPFPYCIQTEEFFLHMEVEVFQ